jgi:hypothetical protein
MIRFSLKCFENTLSLRTVRHCGIVKTDRRAWVDLFFNSRARAGQFQFERYKVNMLMLDACSTICTL